MQRVKGWKGLQGAFVVGWALPLARGFRRFVGLLRALQGQTVQRDRVQQYREGKKEGRREEEETETAAAAAEKGKGWGRVQGEG